MIKKQPLGLLCLMIALSACGQSSPSDSSSPAPTVPTNPGSTASTGGSSGPTVLGDSCVSNDPNHQCLGLKIVSYQNDAGSVILNQAQAQALVTQINQVWNQCNIGFQLERYQAINPASKNLDYNTDWQNDADTVRSVFKEANAFVVVAVGSLTGSTIAVTQMPGYGPFGVLVEANYSTNALTVGHELGHYMGLYHYGSSTNLMNAYIGSDTSGLTTSQCQTARSTNLSEWSDMFR